MPIMMLLIALGEAQNVGVVPLAADNLESNRKP